MNVPRILLEKYNSPVPRYTSYPPANLFHNDYTQDKFINAVIESNECEPKNISIYIHIPYCKRHCFFCGCNMSLLKRDSPVKDYIDSIKKEIKMVSRYIDKDRKLSQIHYGGGTPNAIPAEYIKEINELLFSEFKITDNAEIAIECNPSYLDKKYSNSLNEAGFNRYSLGIQDFNHDILKTVNREIPERPISEIMDELRNGNEKTFINLDFIYGMPSQTVESFLENMSRAVSIRPERLVTFSYAHVPWVNKAQMALEKAGLPDPLDKLEMFFSSYDFMKNNGYFPIGLDHYVLEKDELYKAFKNHNLHRNFQGYCTRETTGQVYAFGMSSISQMERNYSQNTKSVEDYINTINDGKLPIVKGYALNDDEITVRAVINSLMCNKKIDFRNIADDLNKSDDDVKKTIRFVNDELDSFAEDGIITYDEQTISMTEPGILFIRNVAASLDPAIRDKGLSFSKSV